jgi:hypothetical protein
MTGWSRKVHPSTRIVVKRLYHDGNLHLCVLPGEGLHVDDISSLHLVQKVVAALQFYRSGGIQCAVIGVVLLAWRPC